MTDSLGQVGWLTGHQTYVESTVNRLVMGFAPLTTAPVLPPSVAVDVTAASVLISEGSLVSSTLEWSPNVPANTQLWVYASPPVSAGQGQARRWKLLTRRFSGSSQANGWADDWVERYGVPGSPMRNHGTWLRLDLVSVSGLHLSSLRVRPQIFGGGSSLLNDLVAWWDFDDPEGRLVDRTGLNPLTQVGAPEYVRAVVGEGIQTLPSGAGHVQAPGSATLNSGPIQMTIGMWVRSGMTANETFASKTAVASEDREWDMNKTGAGTRVALRVWTGSTDLDVFSRFELAAGRWQLIWWLQDAGEGEHSIQIDQGAPLVTVGAPVDGATGSAFAVGRNPRVTSWSGRVDQVMMWRRLLTASERAQIWQGGAGLAWSEIAP